MFEWEPYRNKHYENRFTRLDEGYWMPKKLGYDKRKCYYSSLILSEQPKRDEALKLLKEEPYPEVEAITDMSYVANQLEISVAELSK